MQEYITKEKYDSLKTELELLVSQKRKEVAEKLEYAKSLGDLSENAEYHEARDEQAMIEDRIKKIESILKSATIVNGTHSTEVVSIGSSVTINKEGEKTEKEYILVGAEESDISIGKISIKSPLGEALVGKKKGDKFTFNTPSGPTTYKIISIK